MLSICIPVFNVDITNLLVAVHNQCKALTIPYEVLVHNDLSTIEIYSDNAVINCIFEVTEETMKQGSHGSRALLADTAKYKYLLFLDADVALPHDNFIQNYVDAISTETQLIYGGVIYESIKPEKDKILRWKYGRTRESRTVIERQADLYQNIISMAFLVRKKIFKKIDKAISGNFYGLDILFSAILNDHKFQIHHINNPVVHLGLENNSLYYNKSLRAVESTAIFTKKGMIPADFRPMQRAYIKIKKYRLIWAFQIFIFALKSILVKNILSNDPSLRAFDILKLDYYIKQLNK